MDDAETGRVLAARRRIGKFSVLSGLVALADFMFGAVYVDELLRIGFSPAFIGIAFFVAFLVSTAVEVPSGDWGDRYGQRRVAWIGLVMWGMALVAFLFLTGIPALLVAVLTVWSVGQSLYSGAPIALTMNEIPPDLKNERLRVMRMANVAKWAGSATGALTAFLGLQVLSASQSIAIAGGVLMLLALWLRLGWRESSRVTPEHDDDGFWVRLRAGWSPALWPLLLMMVLSSALLSVFLFAWQPLMARAAVVAPSGYGLVLLGLSAVAALGAWMTRFRRPGHGVDMIIALALAAAALALAGAIPLAAVTLPALDVVELTTSYAMTALGTDAHAIFEDRYRNMLWSVFSAANGIAMGLADLLFGRLWDAAGMGKALTGAGACGIAVCLIAALIRQHPNQSE